MIRTYMPRNTIEHSGLVPFMTKICLHRNAPSSTSSGVCCRALLGVAGYIVAEGSRVLHDDIRKLPVSCKS